MSTLGSGESFICSDYPKSLNNRCPECFKTTRSKMWCETNAAIRIMRWKPLDRLQVEYPALQEGPVQIGDTRDLDSTEWLSSMAGTYFVAFTAEARTYPYLRGTEG